jgi:hypothetical protein
MSRRYSGMHGIEFHIYQFALLLPYSYALILHHAVLDWTLLQIKRLNNPLDSKVGSAVRVRQWNSITIGRVAILGWQ